jgi:phosphoglycerate dehydrogenase-like enzyme
MVDAAADGPSEERPADGPVQVAFLVPQMREYIPILEDAAGVPLRIVSSPTTIREDVLPLVRDADVVVTAHWTADMAREASRVRLIHVAGAGFDRVDFSVIPPTVVVANCHGHERAIAEWTLMMSFALSRHLLEADASLRRGDWSFATITGHPHYRELATMTMGVVGLGHIGQAVAGLSTLLGLRVVGVSRTRPGRMLTRRLGLAWADTLDGLPRLLEESDFVLLACPLVPATRHLISAPQLRLLGPGSYLLNPARAGLVDERALYEALRDRTIAGAALDTWWHYPSAGETVAPSSYPFASLANCIMTPHIAGGTVGTMEARMRFIGENITRFMSAQTVLNRVVG